MVTTVSFSDADFDVYLYLCPIILCGVQLGSVLGIYNPLKCLSKDTMASAFVDRAEAYWMASSISRLVSPVSSIALISSAMLVW
jgi:hypothetical protein